MRRALDLAVADDAPFGPNPRVGCVLLAPDGRHIAEGHHRGAGTPHAEVDALAAAGDRARGATAVVTLEPCNHTGRTGPCTEALIAAGVRRVVFAQTDPNPEASGGAGRLRDVGIDVEGGLFAEEAAAVNQHWTFAVTRGRPYVTWKVAATLDGRTAAQDGTSRWVSSRAARADAHLLRARCDVVLAGTGTVAVDDPHLTVRDRDGALLGSQPLRAVMGLRAPKPGSRVLDDAAETVHLRTRDPRRALEELHRLQRRHVLLEGGPTLAAAFLRDGLIDEVVAYLAPTLLGAGSPVIGDLGIATITDALHLDPTDVTLLTPLDPADRPNLRLTLRPTPPAPLEGEC
ncbi:bifunctional diaminohydroxyphosphoribosylaminopyrimidine deaminase/5-amino-6-(5-phosphoribosylamino)uracil reductase RibD [Tessaracoccus sp. G1721]